MAGEALEVPAFSASAQRSGIQRYRIGFSIAHPIIGRHGGRIWAEGEAGKGEVFHFTLPDT